MDLTFFKGGHSIAQMPVLNQRLEVILWILRVADHKLVTMWFNTRQPIDTFSASFNYRAAGFVSGLSFIIQDNSQGTGAVNNFSGGGFGGIGQSWGVLFLRDGSTTIVRVQENGVVGSGGRNVAPHSTGGSGFDVSLDYNGTLLTITIDDGTNDPVIQTVFVSPSIANLIGSGDALIGFGAFTLSSGSQRISNFQFSSTAALIGDVSLDDNVNFLDIAPFVALLSADDYQIEGDINRDGNVDFLDIAPFIDILAN